MDRAFAVAIKTKAFKVFTYNFLNEFTKLPTNIEITGIGLASAEYESDDSRGFECIILLDNKQFFFYAEDSLKNTGRYVICDNLIHIRDFNPCVGLIEKAKDTIANYPM
jgi:hypothetical protein